MAQGPTPASRARPERGDRFVFATGDKEGQPVTLADLKQGEAQVFAWAVDPRSGTIRNGSRLNQVLLIRLDPEGFDEATRKRSADGIVAYSAVCPHEQCPVSEWNQEKNALHCPCHGSEFNPGRGGRVVGGPAPRSLPALPITIDNGALVVAGPFTSRVGRVQG